MASRDQRQRLGRVSAQFVGGAGFSGIVAGRGDASAQRVGRRLEAADVVALPAMERYGNPGELRERDFGVDAEITVAGGGQAVGCVQVARHRDSFSHLRSDERTTNTVAQATSA